MKAHKWLLTKGGPICERCGKDKPKDGTENVKDCGGR